MKMTKITKQMMSTCPSITQNTGSKNMPPMMSPLVSNVPTTKLSFLRANVNYFALLSLCGLWLGHVLSLHLSGIVFVPSIMSAPHIVQ